MNPLFIKFAATFLVGALWVTLVTVIAEKRGSKLGGFIGGTPSTSVVTLFFIGFIQSVEHAQEATTIIPVIMGLQGLFAIGFIVFSRHSFWVGLLAALALWFLLSMRAVAIGVTSLPWALVFFVAMVFLTYLMTEKVLKVPSRGRAEIIYTPTRIAGRAVFAGFMVTFGVVMSYLAGPVWGGVFACFPALFISALIIVYYSSGVEFARGIAKTFMIGGMVGVTTYAMAVRLFYPLVGLWWGTFVSYGVGLGAVGGLYWITHKKLS